MSVSVAQVVTALLCLRVVYSSHVLMITLGGTRSHKVPFLALGQGLVSKGHRVTLVSAFPPSHNTSVEEVNPKDLVTIVKTLSDIDLLGPKLHGQWAVSIWDIINYAEKVCDAFYSTKEVQQLLSWKPDLLMLDGAWPECLLGLVHHFKVPFIYLNTVAFYSEQFSLAGNPTMYSVTPFFDSPHSDRMTFWERSKNGFYHIVARGVVVVINKLYLEPILRRHFGNEFPSIDYIGKNVNMIFHNGHHTVTYPRPFLPGVIEIACIHCEKPKSLPKDLEDFVTGGKKNGFIYVSFGTSVQSSHMPEALRRLMVGVFEELPYQVLWKYEADGNTMPDLPDNVRVGQWFPQQDLLGHKEIRAFVHHGGLHSIIESVYHGVPMVAIPVFCDHLANSRKTEVDGYAVMLDLYTMTAEHFLGAIKEVIDNKRYKDNVLQRSVLLRDQPEHPLNRAIYWVQYVLRHSGAPHLQSAAKDLSIYQYYMLDTLVVLIVIACVIVYIVKVKFLKRRNIKKLKKK